MNKHITYSVIITLGLIFILFAVPAAYGDVDMFRDGVVGLLWGIIFLNALQIIYNNDD